MKILLFGRLGALLGPEVELDMAGAPATVREIRQRLAGDFPHAADELARPSVRACIAEAIVDEDRRVAPGETLEFFPPVSGG